MHKIFTGVSLLLLLTGCGQSGSDPAPEDTRTPGNGLWIGTVTGERTDTSPNNHFRVKFLVRLRETKTIPVTIYDARAPGNFRIAGYTVDLRNEATHVESGYEGTFAGCPADQSSTTYSDEAEAPSHIWYKTVDSEVSTDNRTLSREGSYTLNFGTCCWQPCDLSFNEGLHYGLGFDSVYIGADRGVISDPDPDRHMSEDRSRMVGSYAGDDTGIRYKVQWDICRTGSPGCTMAPPTVEPPPAPRNPCDPDLMKAADRKWQAAQDLFKASEEHLNEASKEFKDWKTEEAKTMAEISLEKYDLMQTVELALTEGGKHMLHGAVGWFGIATTAAWIETDVRPHVREHNQAASDAAKMTDAGAALADSAIADLTAALAQSLPCEQYRRKIADREKLLEQAKKLREEWSLDGSALYKDPNDPGGYPMDAGAALKHALQTLTGSTTATRQSPGIPAAPSQGLVVTAEQAQAAMAQMNSVVEMMNTGRALMEKRAAFIARWSTDIRTLNTQWQAQAAPE
jgi:hypothetical protein